jgi:hypothetical protein
VTPPHAPGERESDALLLDRHRMKMQKEIRQHDDNPIPPVKRHWMPEDALPDLRITNCFADGHRCQSEW